MSDKKIGELVILLGQIGLYFANNELPKFGAAAIQSSAMLEDLERQLAEARARLEWQPIESAPKDGTNILGWHEDGHEIVWWQDASPATPDDYGCDAGWWGIFAYPGWSYGNQTPQGQPTYWMPLPLPPKEDTR